MARTVLRHIILKLQHAQLARGVRGWRVFVRDQKRAQEVLQVVVKRMCQSMLWKAFGQWLNVKQVWESQVMPPTP